MTWGTTNSLIDLGAQWNRIFHAPLEVRTCALLRISYALLVLIWLAVLAPDLETWFGEHGRMPLDSANKLMPHYAWSLLQFLPATSTYLYLAFGLAGLNAVLLLAGCFSRLNAACIFIWINSFANRNELILDGEDAVFRLIGFFLIWMPCGACWSLDAWLFRARTGDDPSPRHSAWGLRLLQIQMCLIFLSAGICKLLVPAWRDGTAMYYVSRLDDYFGRFPTPDFFWQSPAIVLSITWGAMAVELVVPLIIWWPAARRWALLAAVVFHLANEYTMHLFLFHWIMLAGWASFLTTADFDALQRWIGRQPALPIEQ